MGLLFNTTDLPAYAQGRDYFRPGMQLRDSDACPHCCSGEPQVSDRSNARTKWMCGFFDAYFQNVFDRLGLGDWPPGPLSA